MCVSWGSWGRPGSSWGLNQPVFCSPQNCLQVVNPFWNLFHFSVVLQDLPVLLKSLLRFLVPDLFKNLLLESSSLEITDVLKWNGAEERIDETLVVQSNRRECAWEEKLIVLNGSSLELFTFLSFRKFRKSSFFFFYIVILLWQLMQLGLEWQCKNNVGRFHNWPRSAASLRLEEEKCLCELQTGRWNFLRWKQLEFSHIYFSGLQLVL